MASWDDVSFSIPAIEQLDATADAVDAAAAAAGPVAKGAAAVLRAIAAFQGGQDAVATVVRQATDALEETLTDFLSPSAGHVLFIPPIPPFRRKPERPKIPVRKLADIVYTADLVRGPLEDLAGDGGNYGIYRKFVESLFDVGDYARPSYGPDAYVGGVILVFGNDTFASTLQGLLSLDAFTGGVLNIRADNYQIPVPQNVKARPIATPATKTLSGLSVVAASQVPGEPKLSFSKEFLPFTQNPQPPQEFAVRVEWDRPDVLRFEVDFGPYVYQLKRWHVYIKKGGRIEHGENLESFEQVSLGIPSVGYGVRPGGLLSVSGDVAGNVSGVVLTDLEGDQAYYISVGYTVEVQDLNTDTAQTITPSVATLSNQVRVNLTEQAPYNQLIDGLPPDWLAVSSPLAFFPIIQDSIRQVKAAIDVVLANYADYDNEVAGIADSLEQTVETVQALAAQLSETTARGQNIIDGFDIGTYAATFSGQGGVPYLVRAVGELLLGPSTDNKPPFERGDEAVSALVLLTGSDTAAGVESFIALAQRLFGVDGANESAGFQGINSVDRTDSPGRDFEIDESGNPVAPGSGYSAPQTPGVADLGVVDEDPC